jgi:uncharacterized membrane protein YdjX (TVP38/TMEM64 family)
VAGLGVLLLGLLIIGSQVDVGDHLRGLQDSVRRLGAWGPVVFILIYVAATLVAVPGMPFTLVSPLIFGPWLAFVVMVIASQASAALAFLIARYLARDTVAHAILGNPTFARLDRLLEAHAWLVIPFARVVPFPFALNNYGFGLTRVAFWRYVALSAVGMVPMNAVFVFGVDGALRTSRIVWPQVVLAAVAAIVVVVIGRAGWRVWTDASRAQSR